MVAPTVTAYLHPRPTEIYATPWLGVLPMASGAAFDPFSGRGANAPPAPSPASAGATTYGLDTAPHVRLDDNVKHYQRLDVCLHTNPSRWMLRGSVFIAKGRPVSGSVTVYKYHTYLAVLSDCPPGHCVPRTLTAYRFVYVPDPKNESFLPQGIKKPARMFEGDDQSRCSLMAISIFATPAKAKKTYGKLAKKHNVRELLGTHLAALSITPTHGHVSSTSSSGHVDLHEFNGCDLAAVAQIVEAL